MQVESSNQTVNQEKPQRINLFCCPNCGASLSFQPQQGTLKCSHCGQEEQIASSDYSDKVSYDEFIESRAAQLDALADNALQVECADCGAIVIFTPPEVAGACAFCGTPLVGQPVSADPLIAPQSIIPFSITSEQAQASARAWASKLSYVPNKLRQTMQVEQLAAIYLPFWIFNLTASTQYTIRGQRRQEQFRQTYDFEKFTRILDDQTNYISTIRSEPKTIDFDNLGRLATKLTQNGLIEKEMYKIDIKHLKQYDPGFLAGFKAQRYQIGPVTALQSTKDSIQEGITIALGRIRDSYISEYDHLSLEIGEIEYRDIKFNQILLPFYLAAFRYEGKTYQLAISGQSGEVEGEYPVVGWKKALHTVEKMLWYVGFPLVILYAITAKTGGIEIPIAFLALYLFHLVIRAVDHRF